MSGATLILSKNATAGNLVVTAATRPKTVSKFPRQESPHWQERGNCPAFPIPLNSITHIHQNMPFFRADSLTSEEAWSLTAYILRLNDRQTDNFTLNEINGSAISVHHKVKLPESEIPGASDLGRRSYSGGGWSESPVQTKLPSPSDQTSSTTCTRPASQRSNPVFDTHWARAERRSFYPSSCSSQVLLEMYYYVPTPEQAAISVETINTLVPFGSLIRNLHFWAAQFLVIVMTIHLLRVTLTGAYAPPRRFNHVLGVGLLVFILLLDFTGYVLRWDEGIHWALVVGANILKTIPWIGDGLYQFVIGGS